MEKKVYLNVTLKTSGAIIGTSANGLLADKDGKIPSGIGSNIVFAQFPSISKLAANVRNYIATNSVSKKENGSFVCSEDVVTEATNRIADANKLVTADIDAFTADYTLHKNETEEMVRDYCTTVRKFGKTRTEKVVKNILSRYPSISEIQSRPKIYLLLDYEGTEESTSTEIQEAVSESRSFQQLSEYKSSMLKAMLPIWNHLGKLLNQAEEDGEMSERTKGAYMKSAKKAELTATFLKTIEETEIDNIEIGSHDLDALVSVAKYAVTSELYAENILLAIFKEAKYLGIETELDTIANYSFDELNDLCPDAKSLRDLATEFSVTTEAEEEC
jgi:hypothetical protein